MKQKRLIVSSIVFFLIVNTMPLWGRNLGIIAFLVFLALIGIYIILGLIFIGQLRKAIKEKFKNKSRNITLSVLGLVLIITLFRPYGVIDYEKFEGSDILIAEAEGAVSCCVTTFELKDDYTFKEKSVCFGMEEIRGKYHLKNDTILFKEVKLNKFTDKYYDYAVIEFDDLNEKHLYFSNKDESVKRELDIVKDELIKWNIDNSIGKYVGRNETSLDECELILEKDKTFKISLYANGDYEKQPKEILIGNWKISGKELILQMKDNRVIYELKIDEYSIAGKELKTEIYRFKTSEKTSFASDFDFFKDNDKIIR